MPSAAENQSAYPRLLTPGQPPFDSLELARRTEAIVCDGHGRKYTGFYGTGVYGGIGTGYTVGCCLRCVFCWVDRSRDYPEDYGRFFSPKEAFANLSLAAKRYGTKKLRISGAEPTIGRDHLLGLLRWVERSEFELFILETNGIILGSDPSYVGEVSRFSKAHVRVSLKAGTPDRFTAKTGARKEDFDLPFQAVENLLRAGAGFHVAAMSADPRLVSREEREALGKRLRDIHPALERNLEEEICDPYHMTLERLKAAGFRLKWRKY